MKTLIKIVALVLCVAFVSVGCEKKAETPAPDGEKKEEAATEEKKEEAPAEEKKEEAAAEEKKEDAEATTCAALAAKVVDLLKEQGENAMLKAEDVPKLTQGCEKGKTLENNKEDVDCVMKTADLKGMGECTGANKMVKEMMANAD